MLVAIEYPGGAPYRLTVRFVSAAVVAASLALVFLGSTAYTAARAEQTSRHLVTARLVEAAGPPLIVPGAPAAASPYAFAQWTMPDGGQHTGLVRADPYQPAGTEVSIWVDTAGKPTAAPATPAEATTQAALLVGLAALGFAVAIGMTARRTAAADRRRRYAAIDREWAQVEPEWTGRHR